MYLLLWTVYNAFYYVCFRFGLSSLLLPPSYYSLVSRLTAVAAQPASSLWDFPPLSGLAAWLPKRQGLRGSDVPSVHINWGSIKSLFCHKIPVYKFVRKYIPNTTPSGNEQRRYDVKSRYYFLCNLASTVWLSERRDSVCLLLSRLSMEYTPCHPSPWWLHGCAHSCQTKFYHIPHFSIILLIN